MPGTVIESSFSRGEVTPELGGRVDVATYKTSLATCRNMIVRSFGGVYNRPGSQFIGFAVGTGKGGAGYQSRLRKFKFNTTDSYILEFGIGIMRVIKNDAYVLDTLKAIGGVAYVGNIATITLNAHGYTTGDMLIIDQTIVGANLLAGRWVVVGITTVNTFQIIDPVTGLGITNFGTAYVSGGQAGHVYSIATPYGANDLSSLSFVQSADVMTITVVSQDERQLTRTGDAAWTLTTSTFAPSITAPTGLSVTPNPAGAVTSSYVVTAIDASTGEESLPCAAVTVVNAANPISTDLSWVAPVGFTVGVYSVYRAINGIYGFIGDTPGSVVIFHDANYAPDLSTTPPIAGDPFTGGTNKPATAMYFQQRLIRSGSLARPDTLYGSQVGLYYNFTVAQPATPSDALTITLTSREVNQVRHMVPIKQDLIVFTAGQEWRVTANGQAFSAQNLSILPQSAWGSGYLEPVTIGLTILYARDNGMMVRSARYTYLSDAYTGEELSLLSSHMFSNASTVTAWAGGLTPDPIVVCTLSNGQIACLTYQEEQQVTAWTRWDTEGAFESVEIARPTLASLSLDEEIYVIVNRVVNGRTNVRTVEKLRSRRFTDVRDAYFVDAGLSYETPVTVTNVSVGVNPAIVTAPSHGFTTGRTVTISGVTWLPTYDANWALIAPAQLTGNNYNTITVIDANTFSLDGVDATDWIGYLSGGTARLCASAFSGLYHLEGQPVVALADGNVITDLTVVDGQVTFPNAVGRAHIGRRFFADLGTQALESSQGSIQGKEARVPYCTVRVKDSRGWLQGQLENDLVEARLRQFEDIGDPLALATDDIRCTMGADWENSAKVFIRQANPLPLEVLAIIPAIDLED